MLTFIIQENSKRIETLKELSELAKEKVLISFKINIDIHKSYIFAQILKGKIMNEKFYACKKILDFQKKKIPKDLS